jgi:predicted O-methyltransferase YrrM
MGLVRQVKDSAKAGLHGAFELGQRLGIDVLPRHFYSEIPDIHELRHDDKWKLPRSMKGIRGADISTQLAFAQDCVTESLQASVTRQNIHQIGSAENGAVGYGPIEAEFLYCFIGSHKPGKIIQVGSGVSTSVILHAAKDTNYRPEITCIDPYPTYFLSEAARRGDITLVPKKCQDVDLSLYTMLGPGDLLFVDSTHTVKPGSEVNLLILEVLPRLNPGVLVHFHDIYFPYDYPSSVLTTLFFPNESALLEALLTDSPRYSILVSLSMLHYGNPQGLQQLLPHYQPEHLDQGVRHTQNHHGHFPSSTYLQIMEMMPMDFAGASARVV